MPGITPALICNPEYAQPESNATRHLQISVEDHMKAKSSTAHQAEILPEALVTKHLRRGPKRVTKQAQVLC